MRSDPQGVSVKGYFAIPTKTRTRSRWGARCPVYFQPGVTHFFPEALFLSHSLSCSAADPPGRAPNPPPLLIHPHPPPSGCPKADTSRDDGLKTQVLLLGEGKTSRKDEPGSLSLCVPTTARRLLGASSCLWLHNRARLGLLLPPRGCPIPSVPEPLVTAIN